MKQDQWTILDLETTGRTPQSHVILECAMLLIDSKTLAIQDEFNRVVGHDRHLPEMDAYVWKMHTDSGLLDAVQRDSNPRKPLSIVGHAMLDAALCSFMQEHEQIIIVGQSPGALDLPFIRWHLPQFAKKLHYRSIDVRTALRLYEEWVAPLPNVVPQHRAIADCLMSLSWLKFLKERAFAKPQLSGVALAQSVDTPYAFTRAPDGPGDAPVFTDGRNFDGNGTPV